MRQAFATRRKMKPKAERQFSHLKKVNLGCGANFHPDWINIDAIKQHPSIIAFDLRKKLPFKSDSIDVIYHSHLLEHFESEKAREFLFECFRVLKPGGIMRVVVPDLEQIARLYLDNLQKAKKGDRRSIECYDWTVIELLDQVQRNFPGGKMAKYWQSMPLSVAEFVQARMGDELINFRQRLATQGSSRGEISLLNKIKGRIFRITSLLKPSRYSEAIRIGRFRLSGEIHNWMYDEYSLMNILSSAGFIKAKRMRANQSWITDFGKYGLDINGDGKARKPDSLFMETMKPIK